MSPVMLGLLLDAFLETLVMVAISSGLAAVVGVPLGVILVATSHGHIRENAAVNRTLGAVVNAARSTPFIILLVAIIPALHRGASIGTAAAIVPLTIAAIPFVARLAESALREVDQGLIEAAQAMGATPLQIVLKVLVPEALPGLVAALTITVVNLISYSAMAGAVGGGPRGPGDPLRLPALPAGGHAGGGGGAHRAGAGGPVDRRPAGAQAQPAAGAPRARLRRRRANSAATLPRREGPATFARGGPLGSRSRPGGGARSPERRCPATSCR